MNRIHPPAPDGGFFYLGGANFHVTPKRGMVSQKMRISILREGVFPKEIGEGGIIINEGANGAAAEKEIDKGKVIF